MSQRLIVLHELPSGGHYTSWDHYQPTAADIIGWLSDHPDVWVEVVRAFHCTTLTTRPDVVLRVGQLRRDPTTHDRVVEVMAVELPGLSTHASVRNTRTGRLTRILRSTLRRWPLELR